MRKRLTRRGRPSKNHSRIDVRLLEYLTRIALEHEVAPGNFFNKIQLAWNDQESTCESLTIQCRKKNRDHAIFLITNNNKVLAQLKISNLILTENNPLKAYMDTIPPDLLEKYMPDKNPDIKEHQIGDLKQRMRKVNVKARVIEIPEPKSVYTKYGTQAYVSNVLIADETGEIRLSLWNQQISNFSVNDVIQIENAKVVRFMGKRQLRLGRIGKLSVIDGDNFPSIEKLKS